MPLRAGEKMPRVGAYRSRSAVHPRLTRDRSLTAVGGDSERPGHPGGALYGTALRFVYAGGHCLLMLVTGTSVGVVESLAHHLPT